MLDFFQPRSFTSPAVAAADNSLRLELVILHFARLCTRNFGQTHESVHPKRLNFQTFRVTQLRGFKFGAKKKKRVRFKVNVLVEGGWRVSNVRTR